VQEERETQEDAQGDQDSAVVAKDSAVAEPEPILFSFSAELPIFLPPLQVVFAKERVAPVQESDAADERDQVQHPPTLDGPPTAVLLELQEQMEQNLQVRSMSQAEIEALDHEVLSAFSARQHQHRLHQAEVAAQADQDQEHSQELDRQHLDSALRKQYPGVKFDGGIGVFPKHAKIDVAVSLVNPFRDPALVLEDLTFTYHTPTHASENSRAIKLTTTKLVPRHHLTITLRNLHVGHTRGLNSIIVHMTAKVAGTQVVFAGNLDFQVA